MHYIISLALLFIGLLFTQNLYAQEDSLDIFDLSLEQLMELKVTRVTTASKNSESIYEAPGVLSVITQQEIEDYGANSLREVLERVTGLYMGGSYLYPQNFTAMRGDMLTHMDNHVLLMLDGRPMREGLYGGLNAPIYLALPLSLIQQIEVIRGPGSVLYGSNAYSGVINLITKKKGDSKVSGLVETNMGTFGTTNVESLVQLNHKELNLRAIAKGFNERGWAMEAIGEDGEAFSTDYSEQNESVGLMMNYKSLNVQALYLNSRQRHLSSQAVFRDQFLQIERFFADLQHTHNFSEKWQGALNLTYNQVKTDFDLPPGPHREQSSSLLLEYAQRLELSPRLRLQTGVLGQYIQGKGEIDLASGETFYMIPESEEIWLNAYLQADYRPFSWLKLTAGGQLNKPEDTPLNLVPRLSAVFHDTNRPLGLKLLFGQAFRSGFMGENKINVPNVLLGPAARDEDRLLPEIVSTLDAQVFWVSPKAQFFVTYFNSQQNNLISRTASPDTASNASIYVNQGTLKSQGIEVEANWKPAEKLSLQANYAFQINENEEGTENYTTVPNHMLKVGIRWSPSKFLRIACFNSWYSAPEDVVVRNPGRNLVNPAPRAHNMLTAKVSLNLTQLLKHTGKTQTQFFVYGYNLLNEEVYFPEFNRSRINSLPATQGRGVYAGLNVRF